MKVKRKKESGLFFLEQFLRKTRQETWHRDKPVQEPTYVRNSCLRAPVIFLWLSSAQKDNTGISHPSGFGFGVNPGGLRVPELCLDDSRPRISTAFSANVHSEGMIGC